LISQMTPRTRASALDNQPFAYDILLKDDPAGN